jgi:hypothetical protein
MSFDSIMTSTLVWTPDKPYHEVLNWSDPAAYWVGIALIVLSLVGMYYVIKNN